MKSTDIGFALDITREEGWGFVRADFERLLALNPGGSFVAVRGAKRLGLVTTLLHGRTCWVGNVVVEAGQRQSGIGRLLMQAALQFAALKGKMRSCLLSREGTAGFYASMGFCRGARLIGLSGSPEISGPVPGPEGVVRVTARLLPEVLVLDREGFGEERRRLLARLARDFTGSFLVFVEGGRAKGFIVGKPGRGMTEVGPWTVSKGRQDIAGALFRVLAGKVRHPLEVYVPARQKQAIDFLRGLGLKERGIFVEMHRGGRRPGPSMLADQLAVAGLEKG